VTGKAARGTEGGKGTDTRLILGLFVVGIDMSSPDLRSTPERKVANLAREHVGRYFAPFDSAFCDFKTRIPCCSYKLHSIMAE